MGKKMKYKRTNIASGSIDEWNWSIRIRVNEKAEIMETHYIHIAEKERDNRNTKRWMDRNREKWNETQKRTYNRRSRDLGFIPLNEKFENSHAHHIDKDYVIYIPAELHRSVWHSLVNNINMEKINALAFKYLFEHS